MGKAALARTRGVRWSSLAWTYGWTAVVCDSYTRPCHVSSAKIQNALCVVCDL